MTIPVSDVDRAKAFYTEKAGFNADHDHRVSDEVRFVQLTPPGSTCSIALGTGISQSQPGSVQGMQMVVSDVNAARAELLERGVEVTEVREFAWGAFVFFSDPDGNGWAVQQIADSCSRLANSSTPDRHRRKDRQRNAYPRAARAGA